MINLLGKETNVDNVNKGYIVTKDINKALFPIEQKPLYFNNNDGIRSEIAHKVLINSNTQETLYVGSNYEIMSNNEIIDLIEKAGIFKEFEIQDVRITNNKRFEFNFIHTDKELIIGDEKAKPRLTIKNSYDASMALQIHLGLYILVCSNGLMADRNFSYKARHTMNKVNEFRDMLNNAHNKLLVEVPEYFSGKEFHNNEAKLLKQFSTLTKNIPDLKTKVNPVKEQLNVRTNHYIEKEKYGKEFSLLMAATDLTTHGYKDISQSYLNILDNNIPETFFN